MFPVDGTDPAEVTEIIATVQATIFSNVLSTDDAIEKLK